MPTHVSSSAEAASLTPETPSRRARVAVAAGVALWAILVGAGVTQVFVFQSTPGTQDAAPSVWPTASRLERADGLNMLVMFVHPRCTCTRASLSELNAIMNMRGADTVATVVFLQPDGVSSDWTRTDTWETAGRIARTSRVVDRMGTEARRFGAHTSGHVVVYDRGGRRLFAGGITDGRGQAGDNVGRQSVLALLDSTTRLDHGHAVFGCALHDRVPRRARETSTGNPTS